MTVQAKSGLLCQLVGHILHHAIRNIPRPQTPTSAVSPVHPTSLSRFKPQTCDGNTLSKELLIPVIQMLSLIYVYIAVGLQPCFECCFYYACLSLEDFKSSQCLRCFFPIFLCWIIGVEPSTLVPRAVWMRTLLLALVALCESILVKRTG